VTVARRSQGAERQGSPGSQRQLLVNYERRGAADLSIRCSGAERLVAPCASCSVQRSLRLCVGCVRVALVFWIACEASPCGLPPGQSATRARVHPIGEHVGGVFVLWSWSCVQRAGGHLLSPVLERSGVLVLVSPAEAAKQPDGQQYPNDEGNPWPGTFGGCARARIEVTVITREAVAAVYEIS
jgi:hypothetical protein